MFSLIRLKLLLLCIITISGCQSTNLQDPTINTLAFCDAAQPIYWSVRDTPKTVAQIKQHNAVGKLCGWGKK